MKILLNNPLMYFRSILTNFSSLFNHYFFELRLRLCTPLGALTVRPQTPQLLWWSIRHAQSLATPVKNPS